MNQVAEEMRAIMEETNNLAHYGIKKRSGRYPYGSGENPYQHSGDFIGRIEMLKKSGWSETPENIKKEFGLTTTQYRAQKALAKDERRMLQVATAKSLREDGLGATEIGRKMGINESTVRSLLDTKSEARMNQAKETAEFLKKQVAEKGMIDVGVGVERQLNISKEKLNQALALLEAEGYPIHGGRVPQVTNKGQLTTLKVLCPPGTEHKEIFSFSKGEDNIHSITDMMSRDGGKTFEKKFHYPASMDSKRLAIRYKEDGGADKDGVVELRRGVDDLSLGGSRYSQVRILVDGTHYIKGMAVYSDNMPDGVDVVFNTHYTKDLAKMDVLKKIKKDPDNPFGSAIKDSDQGGQYWYDGPDGKKKLGLINKRADEGDWTEWKDALPAQFLSKQSLQLAKKQLDIAKTDKVTEYEIISSLNNPTVKKYFLNKFADECDSAAVHLQAAALPGQKYHVILPINTLKDNEIYAPNYENGTKLALIRYPHGGTFEIPILTVNNRNKTAIEVLGRDVVDAVGINGKVAQRLSGADFDGDTVMCIPTHDAGGKVKITSTPPLKGLENFDHLTKYQERPGMRYMRNTQTEMGVITNLITDMTLKGATQDELAAAVRHSMVVIDAEKHKLDYKQSEIDNNISALKKKYQEGGGASTLISKSKSEKRVLKRKGSPKVNMKGKEWYDPNRPEGVLIYDLADDLTYEKTKINKKTGEVTTITKYRMQPVTKMSDTDDAYTLISDTNTRMEKYYADYANTMKSLANSARKEMMTTGKIEYNKEARKAYQPEVDSLMSKLNTALLNAPRERQAQIKANAEINAKKRDNPNMSNKEIKKASQQALNKYRQEVGSVSRRNRSIKITDREWEAIQKGAISENHLIKILANTDVDNLRDRATPKVSVALTEAKIQRIRSLSASNYTLSEIANKLGISTTTVSKYLKGDN